MRKHRHVAARERRLLPGQCIEAEFRLGNNGLAIGARDADMLVGTLGILAALQPPRAGRADLVLRLEINPLRVVAAVIDTGFDAERCQPVVDVLGPAFAPLLEQRRRVPLAHLRAEPVRSDLAGGEHDMGMGFGLAVGADVPVDVEIGDHAAADELLGHKLASERHALRFRQFARDRGFDLAGKLGVLALLSRLDLVPQRFAVPQPLGRAFGQHHFGMDDARLVGEVMDTIEPLVMEPRR
ncbi:hypothetical protein D9M73_93640 [compost metagenome]